ncbi:universal stress protein [Tunicatimonas pelagia]|uniref:universal stress protein n=1 Tax=Tunicatimonas pelagia TaxID=931531 RepID=UPI0026656684|nr:universal stress protein [Tunicatimonas pelagia]WKN41448.1 universal stress protein [Tunicatimonas pelagia]
MMNRILCPVDFSECSLNAVEVAAKVGAAHQASLTLIHVFTEEEFEAALSSQKLPEHYRKSDIDNLVGHAEDMLQQLASEVLRMQKRDGLTDCNYHFTYGPLNRQIVDYAKQHQYSMIVMGTSGVKDIFEEYVGSNTVKTIDRAPCPVLCVPTAASYEKPKKMMYATDYQEEDTRAITRLALFAEPFNAELHVVHLSQSKSLQEQATYQDFQQKIKEVLPNTPLQFEKVISKDDIVQEIDQYALQQEMDMVALLYYRRNFLERLFESSTVKDISYFATYPVLVYRESS